MGQAKRKHSTPRATVRRKATGKIVALDRATPAIAAVLHEREQRATALVAAGEADGVAADALIEGANDALWKIEDQLAEMPAASLADIVLKARVIRAHWLYCDEFISGLQDHLERLFADIETLAHAQR
jgi:hypothetical protein